MKLEISEIKYTVEVEKEKFLALLDYENVWHGGLKSSEMSLDGLLRDAGCSEAEYDGHYSNYIWFTIDFEDDCEEFRNVIAEIITKRLDEAVLWVETAGENDDETA